MYKSRTKNDLMIEVWEVLDCESVGAVEIVAIENAVRERFGESAVDSPMRIARLLADEGAELRHSEIMGVAINRPIESPYDPMFRNILKFADFKQALGSIRQLENLRRKFAGENDKVGLKLARDTAIHGKKQAEENARTEKVATQKREQAEIAEWFTIWLQSPEIFENWIKLRTKSKDFREKFGE